MIYSLDDKGVNDEALELILEIIEQRNIQIRILSLNNNKLTDAGLHILS